MKNLIRISLMFVFTLTSLAAFSLNTQVDTANGDIIKEMDIIKEADANAGLFIIKSDDNSKNSTEKKPKKK